MIIAKARGFDSVFKVLLSLIARERPQAAVDENQERALPQRWRDPPPRPSIRLPFGQRAD